ncbi:MAG: Ig-like domain-containing protein, partial [Granulosicoccus sp.]
MRRLSSFLFLSLIIGFSSSSQAADNLPAQFVVETVLNGLVDPVNLVTLPDGRMFVLEKAGKIKLFDPSVEPATTKIVLGIGAIQTAGERGLASIALDPGFSSNGYYYLYYTQLGNGNRNRVSRFTFNFSTEFSGAEILVWEDNEPVNDCCHFGGGMDFGPDNMLYLATGEEFDGPQAQDLTRAGGKIMRLDTSNLDVSGPWVRGGSNTHIIPTDNPAEIMDGNGPNLDEIWAYGLRNPYRAHWDLINERFYIGEVGGNVQAVATEDLHMGRKGANYGWPVCEGECVDPAYDDPLYFYGHTGGSPAGGAITAGVVYRGGLFPAEYEEVFFFSDYALGFVKYLVLDSQGDVVSVNDFADNVGPIVALELGADEALYGVDYVFGKVIRFSYDSGNQRPEIQTASASVESGAPPLPVQFTATATDFENDSLSYHWFFGDGSDQAGQTVNHTYLVKGFYNAYVVVSDADGSRTSDLIPVQVGSPPIAVIDAPLNGAMFRAGTDMPFSGHNAGPATGGPFTYEWDVKFLHNAHIHPAVTTSGQSGNLAILDHGHDYHDDTGYEFELTVTDTDGLSSTTSVSAFAVKVNLALSTIPAGLTITLDGLPLATPIDYDTAVDFKHVLSVKDTFCNGGTEYEFDSWSNGGQRSQLVHIPETNSSLTANFNELGPCSFIPSAGLVAQFESDQGVETTGQIDANGGDPITAWRDQSGNNNDLTIVGGDPVLAPGGFNGNPVVDFDGFGDVLRRDNGFVDFPFGASDRTIIMVASYDGLGAGGFGYGLRTRNGVFGLHISDEGLLRVNGFAGGNDFVSNVQGTQAGWLVQSAEVESNILTHFKNGEVIDIQNHQYDTRFGPIVLGADLDEVPHVDMQVAAIFVYNRALDDTETAQIMSYLDQKYFTVDGDRVPVANNDNAGVANGGSVSIDVLANDTDDGVLDPASVSIVRQPGSGTASVNMGTGRIDYSHNGVSLTDSFTYTVADNAGIISNPATVSIELDAPGDLVTDGLVSRFESDSGVNATGGLVTGWQDGTGLGNNLSTIGDVTLKPNALGSLPSVVFDGDGDRMERIGNLHGMPGQNFDRTVYLLVKYQSPGYGGFTWGEALPNQAFGLGLDPSETGKLMVQGWGLGNDFFAVQDGVDEGWIVQSAVLEGGLLKHYENGILIDIRSHEYETVPNRIMLAAELDGGPQVAMEVGAVLVYDRALTLPEQQGVQNYLQVKYDVRATNNEPPTTKFDRLTLESGTSGIIDVLANDFDQAGGSLDVHSVAIVDQPTGGTAQVDSISGRITYFHDGLTESDEFTYTVADDVGQVSLPTLVKIKIGTPAVLPTEHLVSRYESDIGTTVVAGNRVIAWNDQIFRYNNHLTGRGDGQFGAPLLVADALNGYPVIRFDGQDDALARFGVLAGYPNKFTDRSIYMVVSYKSTGGGFEYGKFQQNRRFGFGTNSDGKLVVKGGGAANDAVSDTTGTNLGWMVHGADVLDDVMYHRVNNETIDTFSHRYNTEFEGQLVIGADFDFSPFTQMDVVALFVYDDALTDEERNSLHAYVEDKYEISKAVVPVANDDSYEILTNTTTSFSVLDNDTDDLGLDLSTVVIVDEPTGGIATVNVATGTISYTHDGVAEVDSLTYTVGDHNGNVSQPATVSVVVDTDLSPIALNDIAGVAYNGSVDIDVLVNDQDDFGLDATTVSVVQAPGGGTVSIDPVSGLITYQHGGLVSSDFFTYVVLDTTGQRSDVARVDIDLLTPGELPQLGLVARYESDAGVNIANGSVAQWTDLTGSGNTLVGVGDPVLEAEVLGGLPAIRFDGGQDRLQRIDSVSGLPIGDADRTAFFLARYEDTGVGGFSYGAATDNATFGLVVNRFGRLGAQGYGPGNDFFSSVNGNGAGWIVHSATVAAGVVTQYVDGLQIAADLHVYATGSNRIVVGAEIGGSPQLEMQVGAVLVYDRVLTGTERQLVENYLEIKFDIDNSNNEAPVAVADRIRIPSGSSAQIRILDNDTDDSALDLNSVEIVSSAIAGSLSLDQVNGVVNYTHNGLSLSDRFSYRVRDEFGRQSNIAHVTITIGDPIVLPVAGLAAQWESGELVAMQGGSVASWGDLSGFDNELTALGGVSLVPDMLNGNPVLSFDGVDDALFRDDVLHEFVKLNNDRTIFMLARFNGLGDGGIGYGELRQNRQFALQVGEQGQLRVSGRGPGNDFETDYIGTGAGWLVQSAVLESGVLTQAVDGQVISIDNHVFATRGDRLAIGSDLDLATFVDMDLAAILVYKRALSDVEISQVVAYLDDKYGVSTIGVPIVNDDSAVSAVAGSVDIPVLDNDQPVEGAIDAETLQVIQPAQYGSLAIDAVTGVVTYVHDGGAATQDIFTYRVANSFGRYSIEAVVSIEIDSDLSPLAQDDNSAFITGGLVEISVLDNDQDDIALDASSVLIVQNPVGGLTTVDPVSGVVTYQHDGVVVNDSFRYTVQDSAGQVSNEATVTLGLPDELPGGGLVLRLESDTGVTQSGGVITSWIDQSGLNNGLTSTGDPRIMDEDLNLPVIHLDGAGDRLERLSSIVGLSDGNSDRSVFALVKYEGNGFGGFAYGSADTNQAFGVAVTRFGRLAIQGWGSGNDFISSRRGTGEGWLVQSAVLASDVLTHSTNGQVLSVDTHTFATDITRIVLGAGLAGGPQVDMKVAAIIVYDRALDDVEQTQVLAYLESKYGAAKAGDPSPVAFDDAVTIPGGSTVQLAVLDNDSDEGAD